MIRSEFSVDNFLARFEFDFRASSNSDGSESGNIKIMQIGKEIIIKYKHIICTIWPMRMVHLLGRYGLLFGDIQRGNSGGRCLAECMGVWGAAKPRQCSQNLYTC